jgi:hypothetical protein
MYVCTTAISKGWTSGLLANSMRIRIRNTVSVRVPGSGRCFLFPCSPPPASPQRALSEPRTSGPEGIGVTR